jgi:hypothetical protein
MSKELLADLKASITYTEEGEGYSIYDRRIEVTVPGAGPWGEEVVLSIKGNDLTYEDIP